MEDLKEHFPAEIEPFIEFQRSIREVHDMCMKDELDMSAAYKESIDLFEMHRKFLNEVFGLDQTLKMHVIKYHNVIYFKMMGQTLREVSDKYHERVHYTHKNHEIKSVFFFKRKFWAVLV